MTNISTNSWAAHPDPKKVSTVHKMLAPETATQLQKFLRLITYLSPFIPWLSSFTSPLHELLKKGMEFIQNNSCQEAFNKVKSLTCKDTTLQSFDVHKPVSVHVDTSQKGLGAVLLQDGYWVAFASKALTPVLCQHRTWTTCLCLWSRMIPHLCLWPFLHYWEWPQTSWTDQHQESGRYTSLSTENGAPTPELWCHHQVLTWQRDASCRCSLSLCTPQGSRDTSRHHHQPCAHPHPTEKNWVPDSHPKWPTPPLPCWDDHCRLARWYQHCSMCSIPIPWP